MELMGTSTGGNIDAEAGSAEDDGVGAMVAGVKSRGVRDIILSVDTKNSDHFMPTGKGVAEVCEEPSGLILGLLLTGVVLSAAIVFTISSVPIRHVNNGSFDE
jgi:hypothetical protein